MSMNFATDVVVNVNNSLQTSILKAPTTSGGSTYGVGSNGQVLMSNGSGIYWSTYTAPVTSVNGKTGAVTISDSDEKVKYTDLNGLNSSKPILLASDMVSTGASSTDTAYASNKLMWNDYSDTIYVYNSDRSKYIGMNGQNSSIMFSDTTSSYIGNLKIGSLTAGRIYTLPDATGTIALTSDIPSIPSWALESSKPTYTASEVGAMSTSHAANAITSTDISNWDAKVSDDHKWNDVTLNKGSSYVCNGDCYIPYLDSYNQTVAYTGKATSTPTSKLFVKYDSDAYLYSTTPSSSDNSTKVATTAYVTTALSDKVSKSGDTMTGDLIFINANSYGIKFSYSDSSPAASLRPLGSSGTIPIVGFSGHTIFRNIQTPSNDYDATNKLYVDDMISSIAPTYSSSSTYSQNDYCTHNGKLYKANQAISTAENWASAHWTETTVMAELTARTIAPANGVSF